jgi:hypothetical protein
MALRTVYMLVALGVFPGDAKACPTSEHAGLPPFFWIFSVMINNRQEHSGGPIKVFYVFSNNFFK